MDIPSFSIEVRMKGLVPRFKLLTRRKLERTYDYFADNLAVWGKSVDFLTDPKFMDAYRAGMDTGHHILREPGSRADIHIEWRAAVCCWAAQHAKHLEGDLVECGVNTGILSRTVCQYIDLNATAKRFYLFDTYRGIPEEQAGEDGALVRELNRAHYEECYELAKRNFAAFPNAVLVRGLVPDTLDTVPIDKVSYLSIDMNIVAPEIAAMEFFWDKLSPGAPVILDDYGWQAHRKQKAALDQFATRQGVEILLLPTGQGLLLKP